MIPKSTNGRVETADGEVTTHVGLVAGLAARFDAGQSEPLRVVEEGDADGAAGDADRPDDATESGEGSDR